MRAPAGLKLPCMQDMARRALTGPVQQPHQLRQPSKDRSRSPLGVCRPATQLPNGTTSPMRSSASCTFCSACQRLAAVLLVGVSACSKRRYVVRTGPAPYAKCISSMQSIELPWAVHVRDVMTHCHPPCTALAAHSPGCAARRSRRRIRAQIPAGPAGLHILHLQTTCHRCCTHRVRP